MVGNIPSKFHSFITFIRRFSYLVDITPLDLIKFKYWRLRYGLYLRIRWPLQMYEIPLTTVERIEQRCGVFIRKWLGLPKQLNNTALYGKRNQLQLPISSIVEDGKGADGYDAKIFK